MGTPDSGGSCATHLFRATPTASSGGPTASFVSQTRSRDGRQFESQPTGTRNYEAPQHHPRILNQADRCVIHKRLRYVDRRYVERMAHDDIGFPVGSPDDKELLLRWLGYLRGAVMRNVAGLDDTQAHWRPDDKLISLIGVINHLTRGRVAMDRRSVPRCRSQPKRVRVRTGTGTEPRRRPRCIPCPSNRDGDSRSVNATEPNIRSTRMGRRDGPSMGPSPPDQRDRPARRACRRDQRVARRNHRRVTSPRRPATLQRVRIRKDRQRVRTSSRHLM